MLRNVVRQVCRHSTGLVLVAGAIGVLTGMEHLMTRQPRQRVRPQSHRKASTCSPSDPSIARAARKDYFSIRQTKSELGYVYWVLQGFGKYQGFTLFDTWREAIDEAQRRSAVGEPSLAVV